MIEVSLLRRRHHLEPLAKINRGLSVCTTFELRAHLGSHQVASCPNLFLRQPQMTGHGKLDPFEWNERVWFNRPVPSHVRLASDIAGQPLSLGDREFRYRGTHAGNKR